MCSCPIRTHLFTYWFFDHQYFWKKRTIVLKVLNRVNKQGKIAYKTPIAVWAWPCIPSHVQTCPDLWRVNLIGLGVVWLHLNSKGKSVFLSCTAKKTKWLTKMCSCPIRLQDFLMINICGKKQLMSYIFSIEIIIKEI